MGICKRPQYRRTDLDLNGRALLMTRQSEGRPDLSHRLWDKSGRPVQAPLAQIVIAAVRPELCSSLLHESQSLMSTVDCRDTVATIVWRNHSSSTFVRRVSSGCE